jgi:hypothetical protein
MKIELHRIFLYYTLVILENFMYFCAHSKNEIKIIVNH